MVEYCDINGSFATWTGAAGEHPPAHLRKQFSPSYSPSKASNPNRNPFSTSNLRLEEVRERLKQRNSENITKINN